MTRAVIDTSVLIRYLIRPSAAIRELIEERWLGGDVRMVTAPELLDELVAVLARPRIRPFVAEEEGEALLGAVQALAECLPSLGAVPPICRDPDDDKFVACALAGNASHVVTTDADLLTLRELAGVRLCTPGSVSERPREHRRSGRQGLTTLLLNFITALPLAALHGRMGYFPPVIRLRPAADSLPPRYEVVEILNLQAVRDAARQERYK